MKNQHILLLFLALTSISSVFCDPQDDGGLETLIVKGNPDPNSCLLHLSVQLFPNRLQFTEQITNNTPPDCTYQNLTFWSLYRNDFSVSGQVTLSPTADPTVYKGNLTKALINTYNGSACATIGGDYYFCQFKYGQVYFTVSFHWFSNNNTIDTNWTNLFYPVYGVDQFQTIYGYQVLVPGPNNYTGIEGMFYTDCGGWGTSVANLNTTVTITGKIYASQVVNLYPDFANFMADAVIIRQMNATGTEKYLSIDTFGWYPFANAPSGPDNSGGNNCFVTGKKWSDLLPNLNYCSNGCYISLDMTDYTPGNQRTFVLETNGITTIKPNLRS